MERRFGSHAVSSLVSSVISKALGLILVKILTSTLPRESFGSYSIWISFAFLVTTFSTKTFSASIWRFLPRRRLQSDDSVSRLVGASFIGSYLFLALVFSITFFLFQLTGVMVYSDTRYLTTLLFVALLSACYVGIELVLVISGSEQNSREILTFSIFYFGMSTVAAIISVSIFNDYRSVIIWLSMGFVIPLLASIAIKIRKYGISLPYKSDIREIFTFGGPSVVVSSIVTLQPYVASFFVGIYMGTSEIGSLSIALSLSTIFAFIISPPLVAYQSYLVNSYEVGNLEKTDEITSITMKTFLVSAVIIAWLIVLFSPNLILILSTDQYLSGELVVPFVVIASTMLTFSTFAKARIDLVEKTYLTAIVYLVSVVALLVTSILLIPSSGFYGVGLAILFQAIIIVSMLFYFGARLIPFKSEVRFVFCLGVSTAILFASFYILQILSIPYFAVVLISSALYFVVIFVSGALDVKSLRKLKWMILG